MSKAKILNSFVVWFLFCSLILISKSEGRGLTGPVRVIDGDTIEIGGERVRLHGIDAPELKQTCKTRRKGAQLCGVLAKQALEKLLKNQEVTCKGGKRDRYKRLIAVCYFGPFDINEQMVIDGWALAYRKYSKDYLKAETFAKSRREGIWRTEFVPPWEWRKK